MKLLDRHHWDSRAFTLPEVMVAMAASAFMFAAILTAAIGFQRSFSGAMNYSRGTTDQQRALDYVARDVRRAIYVYPSLSTQTLTLNVPDYYASYDGQGNPTGSPIAPTVSNSKINYGPNQIQICYYVQNGQLLRSQKIGANPTDTPIVIADAVENLQSQFTVGNTIIQFSVTFSPTLSSTSSTSTSTSDAQIGTTLVGTVSMRNALRTPSP